MRASPTDDNEADGKSDKKSYFWTVPKVHERRYLPGILVTQPSNSLIGNNHKQKGEIVT